MPRSARLPRPTKSATHDKTQHTRTYPPSFRRHTLSFLLSLRQLDLPLFNWMQASNTVSLVSGRGICDFFSLSYALVSSAMCNGRIFESLFEVKLTTFCYFNVILHFLFCLSSAQRFYVMGGCFSWALELYSIFSLCMQ